MLASVRQLRLAIAFSVLGAAALCDADPCRIMPLGNSITHADSSHDSYRRELWHRLEARGFDVDFVGSMSSNFGGGPPTKDFDLDHEGHWAWRADEILGEVRAWADTHLPDIVLLHIGTNDILQSQSVSSTVNDIDAIIQNLRIANPDVVILLAKIIPHSLPNTPVNGLNNEIPGLASRKDRPESPVIVVDQHTGFNPNNDLYDGVHPDRSGEVKMATKFENALVPFLTPYVLRGLVGDYGPGWRIAAFPLLDDNDVETLPFPAATSLPGAMFDDLTDPEPLVTYRVMIGKRKSLGNRLFVTRNGAGVEISY